MKFDLVTNSVWLAAFAPLVVFLLAMFIDRRRRKRFEKSPQKEKLLRPPGHSLSIRLEKIQDAALNCIVLAFAVCAFAGASVITTVQLLAAHAPVLWLAPKRGQTIVLTQL
jgi:predicted histidine transporter YuiF (NhaC family)